MPAKIKLLVADLGLRYRPSAATDLEAHAHSLALLSADLADLPPDRLERAIENWVRTERWMPKASELVALCQQDQRRSFDTAEHPAARQASDEAYCDSRNAAMAKRYTRPGTRPGGRCDADDIEWFVDGT